MKEQYKDIHPETLKQAFKTAWPLKCMKAHKAEGRDVTYIGSTRSGNIITDYYIDEKGWYWHGSRGIDANGEIVSMNRYLFGHEITKKGKRKS